MKTSQYAFDTVQYSNTSQSIDQWLLKLCDRSGDMTILYDLDILHCHLQIRKLRLFKCVLNALFSVGSNVSKGLGGALDSTCLTIRCRKHLTSRSLMEHILLTHVVCK